MRITKTRKLLIAIFLLGLIYLILPGPKTIDDFPPLPEAVKSNLDGDTWQNVNIVGYYANFRRNFITQFYRDKFARMYLFGNIIPPIVINHRPESAYQYVRDQQASSFLEEYVYPLRESIFVNGYEPAVVNKMYFHPSGFVGNHYWYLEQPYDSKTTLRFYSSQTDSRIIVYCGIWVAGYALYLLAKKAIYE